MAPMHGVGAPRIRDLVAEHGAPGVMCAPFVRVTARPPGVAHIRAQLHRSGDVPLSAQVLGSHPEHLALVAAVLADAGAEIVDLNLGCPTRLAGKKGVGAALLTQFDAIARILEHMRAACTCSLSVKIRTSEGDADEILQVARIIERAGANLLIVHPRSRSQGYAGLADWGVVKRLKSTVGIPVVGNGDLWYAADALRLMRTSGADAVMLGRPALRNPFIFRQIAELCAGVPPYVPSGADLVGHIEQISEWARIDLLRRQHGPTGAVKEQIQFVLRAVPEPLRSKLWLQAMRATKVDAVLAALQPLRDVPELDLAADGPLRFEATPADPHH
jgi:tRNA-dihydrouridine synthase